MNDLLKINNKVEFFNNLSYKTKLIIGAIAISIVLVLLNVVGVMAANDTLNDLLPSDTPQSELNQGQLTNVLSSVGLSEQGYSDGADNTQFTENGNAQTDKNVSDESSSKVSKDEKAPATSVNDKVANTISNAEKASSNGSAVNPSLGALGDPEVAFYIYYYDQNNNNQIVRSIPVYTVCLPNSFTGEAQRFIKPYYKKDIYRPVENGNMAAYDNDRRLYMKSHISIQDFYDPYTALEGDEYRSYSFSRAIFSYNSDSETSFRDVTEFTLKYANNNGYKLCYCNSLDSFPDTAHSPWADGEGTQEPIVLSNCALTLCYSDLTEQSDFKEYHNVENPEQHTGEYYDFSISYPGVTSGGIVRSQFYYYDADCGSTEASDLYKRMTSPYAGNVTTGASYAFPVSGFCGKAIYQQIPSDRWVDPTIPEYKACVWAQEAHIGIPVNDDEHPGFEKYPNWNNDNNVTSITRNNDGTWTYNYKTWNGSSWSGETTGNLGDYKGDIYLSFVYSYGKDIRGVNDIVVPSIKSQNYGINIGLFDYSTWNNYQSSTDYGGSFDSSGINWNKGFKFSRGSDQQTSGNWNHYTGGGSGNDGYHRYSPSLFDKKLADYTGDLSNSHLSLNPNLGYSGDLDLAYLTKEAGNPSTSVQDPSRYIKSYTDLDGLFSEKVYNDTGYFCYGSSPISGIDSNGHFAQLITKDDYSFTEGIENHEYSGKDFVLYQNSSPGSDSNPKFMPFDDYCWDYNNNESLRNRSESNRDYHFGMHISCDFRVPEHGYVPHTNPDTKVDNGGPMVYHFNGDDDMVVYLKGYCLLDLGGIHNKISGDINFANGIVKHQDDRDSRKDSNNIVWEFMDDLWAQSHGKNNASEYDFDNDENKWVKVSEDDLKKSYGENWRDRADGAYLEQALSHYRFADDEVLDFQMFYFERGAQESNLELAFNLQTFNPSDCIVGKEQISPEKDNSILCEDNEVSDLNEGHDEQTFFYRVEVGHENATTGDIEYKPYIQQTAIDFYGIDAHDVVYDVYDIDDTSRPLSEGLRPNSNGCIVIQAGQLANLHGFAVGDKFRVAECDPGPFTVLEGVDVKQFVGYIDRGVIDSLYKVRAIEPYSSHGVSPYDIDKITFEDDVATCNFYGVEDLVAGKADASNPVNNTVVFQNIPINLFDLKVLKRGYNGEASKFTVGFNGTVSESTQNPNTYKFNYDIIELKDGDEYKVVDNATCATSGEDAYKITLEDGQWAMIHNVQMGVRATLTPDLVENTKSSYGHVPIDSYTDWSNSYAYPGGPMVSKYAYPALESTSSTEDGYLWSIQPDSTDPDGQIISAMIPRIHKSQLNDNNHYSEIDLMVENNAGDISIKKEVNPEATNVQKDASYKVSLILFSRASDSSSWEVYTTSNTFEASIGVTEYIASVNSNGQVLINSAEESPHIPELKNNEVLTIKGIVLSRNFAVKAFEANCTGLWYPKVSLNTTKENAIDMDNDDYVFESTLAGRTTDNPMVTSDGDNQVVVYNDFLGHNMTITKSVVNGTETQTGYEYVLTAVMYKNDSGDHYPGPADTIYLADYNIDGSSSDPLTYEAKIKVDTDEDGNKVSTIVTRPYGSSNEWELPVLKNNGYITIQQIIPMDETIYYSAYEKELTNSDDLYYWRPYATFNTDPEKYLINSSLGDGRISAIHASEQESINKIDIVNEFVSNYFVMTKQLNGGTKELSTSAFGLSAILYKNDELEAFSTNMIYSAFTCIERDYEHPTAYYNVKIDVGGKLLFKSLSASDDDPWDLIYLKDSESVVIANIIPNGDGTNPGVYFRPFEKYVQNDFWLPFCSVNSTTDVDHKQITEDWKFIDSSDNDGLAFSDELVKDSPSMDDDTNSLHFVNSFFGNDLKLSKRVEGGDIDAEQATYELTAILYKSDPSSAGDPVYYTSDYVFDASLWDGSKTTSYTAKIDDSGRVLVKGPSDSDFGLPKLKHEYIMTINNILPDQYFIGESEYTYMSVIEKCVNLSSSGAPTVAVEFSEDRVIKATSSVNYYYTYLESNDSLINPSDKRYQIGKTIGTPYSATISNSFGGVNLEIQKHVLNGTASQTDGWYILSALFYSDSGCSSPYNPGDMDTHFYNGLYWYNDTSGVRHEIEVEARFMKAYGVDAESPTDTDWIATILAIRSKTAGQDTRIALPEMKAGYTLNIKKIIPEGFGGDLYMKAYEQNFLNDPTGLANPDNWKPVVNINTSSERVALGSNFSFQYQMTKSEGDTQFEKSYGKTNSDAVFKNPSGQNYIIYRNIFELNNFELTKVVNGTDTEKETQYPVSVRFSSKNDTAQGEPPFTTWQGPYTGSIIRSDSIEDIHAYITEYGELLVTSSSASSIIWGSRSPELADGDKLIVENLLPNTDDDTDGAWYIKAWETNQSGIWHASVVFNEDSSNEYKLNTPYSIRTIYSDIPDLTIKGVENNNWVASANKETSKVKITNTFDTNTGFDILKHPELLTLLIMSLLALLSIIPAKLALDRKKANNADGSMFVDRITGLFTEDFDV